MDFGVPNVPAGKAQRLWKLQEVLLQAYREDKIAVLVIDEAHKLSLEVLEEIRLLGNFEYGSDKFLQIVLLGQCGLRSAFEPAGPSPIQAANCTEALYRSSVCRGNPSVPLVPLGKGGRPRRRAVLPRGNTGHRRILSHGVPRLINSLCDTALLMAFGDRSRSMDRPAYIRDAAINLCLIEDPKQRLVLAHPAPSLLSENLDESCTIDLRIGVRRPMRRRIITACRLWRATRQEKTRRG